MRREIVFPHGHIVKFENGAHHAFDKLGVIDKEKRYGRIAYVYGSDTAVGVAFLGKEKDVSVTVLDKFMRAHRLTESGVKYQKIIFTILFRFFLKFRVESVEFLDDFVVFCVRIGNRVEYGFSALEPVAFKPVPEIENRYGVVKRDGKLARNFFR